jgi:hypothetical protein
LPLALKGVPMKSIRFLTIVMAVILCPAPLLAQVPHQVGGFILGTNIAEYGGKVNMETAIPIRYMEYLKDVEIRKQKGFKSGLICYGNCGVPGRIVRIKLKYADSTKNFYDKLLELFKERFGEPTEWRGDPFKIVIAWKWSFTDKDNNRISLTLQHNTKDVEEKIGNSVKMTALNLMEEEYRCFKERYPEDQKGSLKEELKPRGKVSWDLFIPR